MRMMLPHEKMKTEFQHIFIFYRHTLHKLLYQSPDLGNKFEI